MTPLEEIKDAWDNYCDAQVRASALRSFFRAQMAAAVESGVSQSEIARTLGIARQHVHRYLTADS